MAAGPELWPPSPLNSLWAAALALSFACSCGVFHTPSANKRTKVVLVRGAWFTQVYTGCLVRQLRSYISIDTMSQQAGDEVLVTTGDLQQHSATLKAELSELVADQCSQVADKLSSQISAEVCQISELLAELQKSKQPGSSSAALAPLSAQPPKSPSYNPLFAAPRGSPASGGHTRSPATHVSVATQTEVSREDSDSELDCEANDWFTVDSEFPELRLFAPFIEPGIQAPPQNDPIYPHIYPLIADTTLEKITERKHKAAASEYKYLVCYGFYLSTSVAALKATLAAGVRPSSAQQRLQKLLRAFEAIEDHHRARLAHVRISRSDEAGGSKTLADVFQQIHLSEEPAALGSARFAEFATSFRRQEAASLIAQAAKLTAQKKIGAANKPTTDDKTGSGGASETQAGKKPGKDGKTPKDGKGKSDHWWCGPPLRFLFPGFYLPSPSSATQGGKLGAYRGERASTELDPPWGADPVGPQGPPTYLQSGCLPAGRYASTAGLHGVRAASTPRPRRLGAQLLQPLGLTGLPGSQGKWQMAPGRRFTFPEQPLPSLQHEVRDTKSSTYNGAQRRLDDQHGPTRRFLRYRHRPAVSRLLHCQLPRNSLPAGRATDGLVQFSLRVSPVRGHDGSGVTVSRIQGTSAAPPGGSQTAPTERGSGHQALTFCRRLLVPQPGIPAVPTHAGTHRASAGQFGFAETSTEGCLGGAGAMHRAPRPRDRHPGHAIPRTCNQAPEALQFGEGSAGPGGTGPKMGARQTSGGSGGQGTVSVPCHPARSFLSTGATLGPDDQVLVGVTRPAIQTVDSGPAMVAERTITAQRAADSAPAGDSVHALRFFAVRVGSRTERAVRGPGVLVRARPYHAYHVQGAQGRTTRGTYLPTLSSGPQGLTARRQSGSGCSADPPHFPFPRDDDGAPQALVDLGLPRDHHHAQIYPLRSEYLGRQALAGAGLRRLAAQPSDLPLSRSPLGPPLGGSLRVHGERNAGALQFALAGPTDRGGGLPQALRCRLASGAQLVQPSLGAVGRPRREAAAIGRGGDRHRSHVARPSLVSGTPREGGRLHRLPSRQGHVLPRQARRARGGRALRLERHGCSSAVPSWRHLSLSTQPPPPPGRRPPPRDTPTAAGPSSASQPRYRLRQVQRQPDWEASMRAALRGQLGEDSLGRQALDLMTGSMAPSTITTYGSNFRKFLRFCEEQAIDPFQASQFDILRYLAWIGQEGSVAATSLQPYLSAINRFLGDHGKEPVALGPLVARARQGLKLQQQDQDPQEVRVPLPPHAVCAMLEKAWQGHATVGKAAGSLTLQQFRALLAVVLGYLCPGRGSTSTALRSGEVMVDSEHITVLHLTVKGREGEPDHSKPMLRVPVAAHPQMAALLQQWQAIQATLWPAKNPRRRFWLLPEEAQQRWTADTLTAWLQQACTLVHCSPPPGLKWTSHSLRKGAATYMSAVGVPLPTIRFWGGWARDSSVVLHYIDPTALPSDAAFQLFGWLLGTTHRTP